MSSSGDSAVPAATARVEHLEPKAPHTAVLDGTRVGATCLLSSIPAGGEATVAFRTTVTGFEGAIDVNAVLTAATPDRNRGDNDRSVQVLTSRLETE